MMLRSLAALLAAGVLSSLQGVRPVQGDVAGARLPHDPNVLVFVLDDVGIDLLGAYGEGPGPSACTPWIDALAEEGLLFRNAWANPLCSPTRAQILTGRHGFRTGIGQFINGTSPAAFAGLAPGEVTIAEELSPHGYSSGAFGKWHLAEGGFNPIDPLEQGFDWFEGVVGSLSPQPGGCPSCPAGCQAQPLGYYRWVKSTNGVQTCETRYQTTVTVDDALAVAGTGLPEPWFLYTAPYAIHAPFHEPPDPLCPGSSPCACGTSPTTNAQWGKAALEALDTELGRLIQMLEATSTRPLIVFVIGDNGTAGTVAAGEAGDCFDPMRSKGTLHEGGVNVPLIVWGDGIRAGEVHALVSATDLHATVLELAGVASSAEDSVSLVRYLNGFRGTLRSTVYAERFTPNGLPFAPVVHGRAIRDARYKLIRRTEQPDELYDLLLDPCETLDLFPPTAGSPAEAAWQALDAELVTLGV